MTKFEVWSQEFEGQKVLEVRRTDQKTAQSDAALIRQILQRKAWVEEVEPVRLAVAA